MNPDHPPPRSLLFRVLVYPPAFLFARAPDWVKAGLCSLLGGLLWLALPSRRHLVLLNLYHCFPAWTEAQRRRVARRSFTALIELGAFSFCSPFLSPAWIRRNISVTPATRTLLQSWRDDPFPIVLLIPHVAFLESLLVLPAVVPMPEGLGVMRPLKNESINAYLQWSRARHGFRLLSRKEGLNRARAYLRRRQMVGVPFDQSAGPPGTLMLLFDRVCSTTELPALLASEPGSRAIVLHPRRLRGWRIEVAGTLLDPALHGPTLTQAANAWVEAMLRGSEQDCSDWLWAHNRWKTPHEPTLRLGFVNKRRCLPDPLPRRFPLWLLLPPASACPPAETAAFLAALRRSRPDAHLTLLFPGPETPPPPLAAAADAVEVLPLPAAPRAAALRRLAARYPDTLLLLDDAPAADRDAARLRAFYRFGWEFPGRPRRVLTHAHRISDPSSWNQLPPPARWLALATAFGLQLTPSN